MDIKVYPIAYPNVDWQTFIKVCQSTLGFSPTRGLDRAEINIKTNPEAFLACLALDNKPIENLENGRRMNTSFDHFSVSFLIESDCESLLDLSNYTRLKKWTVESKRTMLSVVTGTMTEWYDAIVSCCHPSKEFNIRSMMTQCYHFFESSGFSKIWGDLTTKELKDNTIIFT